MSNASSTFYSQLGKPQPVQISLLPEHWVVCTYSSTLRSGNNEGDTLDMIMPERTLVTPHLSGGRLELTPYHGRDTPQQTLEEAGFTYKGTRPLFDAAVITPEKLELVTFSPTGEWSILEYPIKGGLLEYEGKFYGDFSVDLVQPVATPRPAVLEPAIGFTPVTGESPFGLYKWDGNPPRPPKKGEHYLSGAIPQAWKASNDLTVEFFIAVKV